jgi:hypothetical protein
MECRAALYNIAYQCTKEKKLELQRRPIYYKLGIFNIRY